MPQLPFIQRCNSAKLLLNLQKIKPISHQTILFLLERQNKGING